MTILFIDRQTGKEYLTDNKYSGIIEGSKVE